MGKWAKWELFREWPKTYLSKSEILKVKTNLIQITMCQFKWLKFIKKT